MRAPEQLIPTGNLRISVATGALVTWGLLLASTRLPEDLYYRTIMMSPFVSGFIGGLIYGGVGTRGGGHFPVIGYLSCVLLGVLLILSMIVLGPSFFKIRLDLAFYIVSLFPPVVLILMVPIAISIVGTIFGWLAALAIRR